METWQRSLPLQRPYTIAFKSVGAAELHFVRLVTETGLVGLGSAAPTDITGETSESCARAITDIGQSVLVGRDPLQMHKLSAQLRDALASSPSARAAIDMALHDLVARSLERPLADILGRRHRGMPTSITIGIMAMDDTLREADEYIHRGFTCLKVKLGHALDRDIERLRALRMHAGPRMRIRVDANQGYSLNETLRLSELSSRLGIELIEQPLPASASEKMLHLPHQRLQTMAADESLHSEADAKSLAAYPQPFGIFNIKLMKCGGITSGLAIANIAHATGIRLIWGCMDESVVSIAAALHAAYACPATRFIDLDGSFDLSQDAAKGGFRLEAGNLYLLDRSGLGVTLKD